MKRNYNNTAINAAIPLILTEATATPSQIAKQIFDSKTQADRAMIQASVDSAFENAIKAMKSITSLEQYKTVLKELQKLTNGAGIAKFLNSFVDSATIDTVVKHLKTWMPKKDYNWTIDKYKAEQPVVKINIDKDPNISKYSDTLHPDKWKIPGEDLKNMQSHPTPRMIARRIYDAKGDLISWMKGGNFLDNPKAVIKALSLIRNVNELDQVNRELKKLTKGRGIGEYIQSFLGARIGNAQFNPKATRRAANSMLNILNKIEGAKSNASLMKPITDPLYDTLMHAISTSKAGSETIGEPFRWYQDIMDKDTFLRNHRHEIMLILEIGALFIPVPVLNVMASSAIGMADAKAYWDEGHRYEARLYAILSAIPLVGVGVKVTLKVAIKKLGPKGLKAFVEKLSKIKSGKPAKFTKEEQAVIQNFTTDPKLLHKTIVDSYKTTKLAKGTSNVIKLTGIGAREYAKIVAVNKAYDAIYVAAGLQLADIQSSIRPQLEKIKSFVLANQNSNAVKESNTQSYKQTYIKELIKEEYIKLITEQTTPFRTRQESDRFRTWLNINYQQQMDLMDVDLTGPPDSPQLALAYDKYKYEYNAWLKAKGETPIEDVPNPNEQELSGWDWVISKGISVYIVLGILGAVFAGAIKVFAGWRITKLIKNKAIPYFRNKKAVKELLQNPEKIQKDIKKFDRMSSGELKALIQEIDPSKVLTAAEEEQIRKAINNPQLTTRMIISARQQAIDDFIKHGGRTTRTFDATDVISMLTDAERAEFGQAIYEYQRIMRFTEI